jgi:hypothetical protein
MFRAAGYWFPKQWAALWEAAAPKSATKPDNNFDAVVRAFSQSPIPAAWQDDAWRHEFMDIWSQIAHRFRNFLHRDTIKAYYFDNNGRHAVACDLWPTPAADGVLETGIHWPFGGPNASFERRPSYPLFFGQSELDALLSEQPAKRRPLPGAKMPELVAALRKLDDLPNRAAQLLALCNMPEFREFTITNALFRQAAKEAGPRRAGRKSRR